MALKKNTLYECRKNILVKTVKKTVLKWSNIHNIQVSKDSTITKGIFKVS